jgi:O-antigen/teichoic acid export membrane protein
MADSHPSNPPGNRFSIRSNIAANIFANVLIAIIFFVSVPLFIRYLGVEGYGLVGFFLFTQTLATVLDLGLMTMLTREFAVLTADQNGDGRGPRDLLRTSEVFYWSAAIVSGLGWTASAGFLSWFVNPQGIDGETLYQCFLLMGITFALQFPAGLYSGALFGLQRQVAISVVSVVFSILRNLGAIAALQFLSSTPQTFFAWQLGCAVLQVPLLASLVRSA